MKNRDPNDRLLGEIFADTLSSDFREELLASTLRHVRLKRRTRKALRGAAAVVAVVCLLAISAWNMRRSGPGLVSPQRAEYSLVRTQPLPPGSLVTTQVFATERVIQTVAFTQQVQTEKERLPFRIIDDRELLALAGEGRAALVRVGPNSEELIFLNPSDANGLPVP